MIDRMIEDAAAGISSHLKYLRTKQAILLYAIYRLAKIQAKEVQEKENIKKKSCDFYLLKKQRTKLYLINNTEAFIYLKGSIIKYYVS